MNDNNDYPRSNSHGNTTSQQTDCQMNGGRPSTNRRRFLRQSGMVSLAGITAATTAPLCEAATAPQQPGNSGPPADLRQSNQPTEADIGSLFRIIDRAARRHDYPYSFLSGRFKDLEQFKAAGRSKLLECFGRQPERVDPRAEIVDRRDLGYCIREKIVFSTTPNFRVPAYLHLPKASLRKPHPAIVDLHSHGGMFLFGKEKVVDLGNNHPVMQQYHQKVYGGRPTSTELVRRGYVVITIDAFMFGERRLIMDKDLKYGWDRSRYSLEDARYLNNVCRSKEATLVKSLTFAGYTWPGIVTWDDMRTVDYLVSRPEVDSDRIGCLGVSMGGHRTLYLAGLDERIAAACVVGFMSTVRPMIKKHVDTHSFVHFVPQLHRYLDLPDVVSMMAPKPLMVQQCRRDGLFPYSGMVDSLRKIEAVYDKAKVKHRFDGRFYEGPHRFDRKMQDDAFAWFDRHLQ